MRACTACGAGIEARFRFCPWCAEPQRLKLVEFFRPHPLDHGKALRVSRYLEPGAGHVRFSVWSDLDDGARAEAAVSLGEDEAARLARFLGAVAQRRPASRIGRLVDDLRAARGAAPD